MYHQYWWRWVYLLFFVASVILQVFVFVKSMGDYAKFVRFVEFELIFEGINLCYQWIVQFYTAYIDAKETVEGVEIGKRFIEQQLAQAVVIDICGIVLYLVLFYFLWYRLNRKYFRKRLRFAVLENTAFVPEENSATQINVVLDNDGEIFCPQCSSRVASHYSFCPSCGFRSGEEARKLVYRVQPIALRSNFTDDYGWRAELATLKSDEIYRRYCDAEEWSEDYRALCYQELVKRQEVST